MSAKYLLDSNICIYLLEGRSNMAAQRVQSVPRTSMCISSIVYAEVMYGMVVTGQADLGQLFFRKFEIVPFDETAAATYASLPFKRASYDRLIAAHTLALGLTLVTNNQKDFSEIPGLTVENWAEE